MKHLATAHSTHSDIHLFSLCYSMLVLRYFARGQCDTPMASSMADVVMPNRRSQFPLNNVHPAVAVHCLPNVYMLMLFYFHFFVHTHSARSSIYFTFVGVVIRCGRRTTTFTHPRVSARNWNLITKWNGRIARWLTVSQYTRIWFLVAAPRNVWFQFLWCGLFVTSSYTIDCYLHINNSSGIFPFGWCEALRVCGTIGDATVWLKC